MISQFSEKINLKRMPNQADKIQTNGSLAVAIAATMALVQCSPIDKRPLTEHGFHDAAFDVGPWLADPQLLIGVPTDLFWVLDIDTPEALQRILSMLDLTWRDLVEACDLVVRTPRRGWHFYFSRTPGLAIGTRAGDIYPGVDTRGHDASGKPSGYIVAPGNVLPDGRSYKVVAGSLGNLLSNKLRPAPLVLLKLVAFGRRDRALIANSLDLRKALAAAEPHQWADVMRKFEAARRKKWPATVLDEAGAAGMRRQALSDLEAEAKQLAALSDGRKQTIFKAALRLAKYSTHRQLSPAEIEQTLLSAWSANGAERRYGNNYATGAIQRALIKGAADPLPPLAARFRTPNSTTRKAD